jgi:hypothetical protein
MGVKAFVMKPVVMSRIAGAIRQVLDPAVDDGNWVSGDVYETGVPSDLARTIRKF